MRKVVRSGPYNMQQLNTANKKSYQRYQCTNVSNELRRDSTSQKSNSLLFYYFFYFSKVRNISAQLERVFEEKSLIQSDLSVKVIDAQS